MFVIFCCVQLMKEWVTVLQRAQAQEKQKIDATNNAILTKATPKRILQYDDCVKLGALKEFKSQIVEELSDLYPAYATEQRAKPPKSRKKRAADEDEDSGDDTITKSSDDCSVSESGVSTLLLCVLAAWNCTIIVNASFWCSNANGDVV